MTVFENLQNKCERMRIELHNIGLRIDPESYKTPKWWLWPYETKLEKKINSLARNVNAALSLSRDESVKYGKKLFALQQASQMTEQGIKELKELGY